VTRADLAGVYENGRVELIGDPPNSWRGDWRSIVVRHDDGRSWLVTETGQLWDAWPYPQCEAVAFDFDAYRQEYLRGQGTPTAEEKIRELVGEPR
jgi:hypothetical protein